MWSANPVTVTVCATFQLEALNVRSETDGVPCAGSELARLTLTVPVVLKGEPKGVKQQGGIVDFVNREIEVECLPGDIPEHIDIDISELMLHQGIRVRDLPQDAKWKATSDADMMIVHVVTVKAEAEPTPAEGAAAAAAPATPAEPEVIKKGKKEEDEKEKK